MVTCHLTKLEAALDQFRKSYPKLKPADAGLLSAALTLTGRHALALYDGQQFRWPEDYDKLTKAMVGQLEMVQQGIDTTKKVTKTSPEEEPVVVTVGLAPNMSAGEDLLEGRDDLKTLLSDVIQSGVEFVYSGMDLGWQWALDRVNWNTISGGELSRRIKIKATFTEGAVGLEMGTGTKKRSSKKATAAAVVEQPEQAAEETAAVAAAEPVAAAAPEPAKKETAAKAEPAKKSPPAKKIEAAKPEPAKKQEAAPKKVEDKKAPAKKEAAQDKKAAVPAKKAEPAAKKATPAKKPPVSSKKTTTPAKAAAPAKKPVAAAAKKAAPAKKSPTSSKKAAAPAKKVAPKKPATATKAPKPAAKKASTSKKTGPTRKK